MTFYFYKRKSALVADTNCYDYTKATSTIVFNELVVTPTDGFYILTAHAQEFSECKTSKSSESSFQPDTKVRLKIARKEYQKEDFQTKEKVSVSPSLVEQAFCKIFDGLDVEKWAFKGKISFDVPTDSLIQFISGKSSTGGNLPTEVLNFLKNSFCDISPFTKSELKKLTSEDLNIEATGDNKNGGNYRPPKSEGDRLQEKFEWMARQITKKFPAIEINSYYDITSDGIENQQIPEEIKVKIASYVLELQVFVLGWSK